VPDADAKERVSISLFLPNSLMAIRNSLKDIVISGFFYSVANPLINGKSVSGYFRV
jgi:hypothetical protein